MTEIKEKQLYESYKYMFIGQDERNPFPMFGFECGDGWYNLLDNLMSKIKAIDVNKVTKVQQIKEKFGTLRFYYSTDSNIDDEVSKFVNEAEETSAQTCETCGKPGKVCGGGWLRCICPQCAKEHDIEFMTLEELEKDL